MEKKSLLSLIFLLMAATILFAGSFEDVPNNRQGHSSIYPELVPMRQQIRDNTFIIRDDGDSLLYIYVDAEAGLANINTAIESVSTWGAGIVEVSRGEILMTNAISMYPNVLLMGQGKDKTIFKRQDGYNMAAGALVLFSGDSNSVIQGITFDQNWTNRGATGINRVSKQIMSISGSPNVTIRDCSFKDYAFAIKFAGNSSNTTIEDNVFYSQSSEPESLSMGIGVPFGASTATKNVSIRNNYFTNNADATIFAGAPLDFISNGDSVAAIMVAGDNWEISGNTFGNFAQTNSAGRAEQPMIMIRAIAHGTQIIDNNFEGISSGIFVHDDSATGTMIAGNSMKNLNGYGIHLVNQDFGITIVNNIIDSTRGAGIYATNLRNAKISDNFIRNTGDVHHDDSVGTRFSSGISIEAAHAESSCDNVSFTDNIIITTTNSSEFGINFNEVTNDSIHDIMFRDNYVVGFPTNIGSSSGDDTSGMFVPEPADDDWTTSGADVYRNTGNVGIGTPTPGEKLDINGTVKSTGIQMTTSPTDGYVLTTDATGVGTWQANAASAVYDDIQYETSFIERDAAGDIIRISVTEGIAVSTLKELLNDSCSTYQGVEFIFLPGTYTLTPDTDTLKINSFTHIRGFDRDSVVIKHGSAHSTGNEPLFFVVLDCSSSSISSLTMESAYSGGATDIHFGVEFAPNSDIYNVEISKCKINGFNVGIAFTGSGNTGDNIRILDNRIITQSSGTFTASSAMKFSAILPRYFNTNISRNEISGGAGAVTVSSYAIELFGVYQSNISDNYIHDYAAYNPTTLSSAGILLTASTSYNLVYGNRLISVEGHGIEGQAKNNVFQKNLMDTIGVYGIGGNGINLTGSDNATIVANNLKEVERSGIKLRAGENISISGNTIINAGRDELADDQDRAAISIEPTSGNTVSQIVIDGNTLIDEDDALYGIYFDDALGGTLDSVIIGDNIISGFDTLIGGPDHVSARVKTSEEYFDPISYERDDVGEITRVFISDGATFDQIRTVIEDSLSSSHGARVDISPGVYTMTAVNPDDPIDIPSGVHVYGSDSTRFLISGDAGTEDVLFNFPANTRDAGIHSLYLDGGVPTPTTNSKVGVTITSPGTSIVVENCEIVQVTTGIRSSGSGTIWNTVISNNRIHIDDNIGSGDYDGKGIDFSPNNAWDTQIVGNTITGGISGTSTGDAAILIDNITKRTLISDNFIHNYNHGDYLNDSTTASAIVVGGSADNTIVTGNIVNLVGGTGIVSYSNSNVIVSNRIITTGGYGVFISSKVAASRRLMSMITGNVITGTDWSGIKAEGLSEAAISGNVIRACGIGSGLLVADKSGIQLTSTATHACTSLTVDGNTIHGEVDAAYGIYLDNSLGGTVNRILIGDNVITGFDSTEIAGPAYIDARLDINQGDNLRSVFNVKFFGAKGDSSTNDAAAIQAAIDAAVASGAANKEVYLPAGHYIVKDDSLVIEGTGIKFIGEASGDPEAMGNATLGDYGGAAPTTGTTIEFVVTNPSLQGMTALTVGDTQGADTIYTHIDISNITFWHGDQEGDGEEIGDGVKFVNVSYSTMEDCYLFFKSQGEAGVSNDGDYAALKITTNFGDPSNFLGSGGVTGLRFLNLDIYPSHRNAGRRHHGIHLTASYDSTDSIGGFWNNQNHFIGCRVHSVHPDARAVLIEGVDIPDNLGDPTGVLIGCNSHIFTNFIVNANSGIEFLRSKGNQFIGAKLDGSANLTMIRQSETPDPGNNLYMGDIDGHIVDSETDPDNRLRFWDWAEETGPWNQAITFFSNNEPPDTLNNRTTSGEGRHIMYYDTTGGLPGNLRIYDGTGLNDTLNYWEIGYTGQMDTASNPNSPHYPLEEIEATGRVENTDGGYSTAMDPDNDIHFVYIVDEDYGEPADAVKNLTWKERDFWSKEYSSEELIDDGYWTDPNFNANANAFPMTIDRSHQPHVFYKYINESGGAGAIRHAYRDSTTGNWTVETTGLGTNANWDLGDPRENRTAFVYTDGAVDTFIVAYFDDVGDSVGVIKGVSGGPWNHYKIDSGVATANPRDLTVFHRSGDGDTIRIYFEQNRKILVRTSGDRGEDWLTVAQTGIHSTQDWLTTQSPGNGPIEIVSVEDTVYALVHDLATNTLMLASDSVTAVPGLRIFLNSHEETLSFGNFWDDSNELYAQMAVNPVDNKIWIAYAVDTEADGTSNSADNRFVNLARRNAKNDWTIFEKVDDHYESNFITDFMFDSEGNWHLIVFEDNGSVDVSPIGEEEGREIPKHITNQDTQWKRGSHYFDVGSGGIVYGNGTSKDTLSSVSQFVWTQSFVQSSDQTSSGWMLKYENPSIISNDDMWVNRIPWNCEIIGIECQSDDTTDIWEVELFKNDSLVSVAPGADGKVLGITMDSTYVVSSNDADGALWGMFDAVYNSPQRSMRSATLNLNAGDRIATYLRIDDPSESAYNPKVTLYLRRR